MNSRQSEEPVPDIIRLANSSRLPASNMLLEKISFSVGDGWHLGGGCRRRTHQYCGMSFVLILHIITNINTSGMQAM